MLGLGRIDGMLDGRALRRWGAAARRAPLADLASLSRDRAAARALRTRLDDLLEVAEGRLALAGAEAAPPRLAGADWAWRPRLWSGALAGKGLAGVLNGTRIGDEASLFHDCPLAEIAVRQVRQARDGCRAPFGLRLDVLGFRGSYLALALDLPPEACEGLGRRHLVRLDLALEAEGPLRMFARLNLRHGPNAEALLRGLPLASGASPGGVAVEFDLACSGLGARPVESAWLDLIVEGPAMSEVMIRDLTLSRLPRAEP